MSTTAKWGSVDAWRHYIADVVFLVKRRWKRIAIPFGALALLSIFVRLDFNLTESLPDKAFVTVKHLETPLRRGDYVTFKWSGEAPYPKGFQFTKIVRGLPGDVVTFDAETRSFFVNGSFVSRAKEYSKTGVPLKPGPVGTIPPGYFYVHAPHVDSLDSRYAIEGWVAEKDVVGRAYAIF